MRLSRGDVVLHQGKFALVWDADIGGHIRVFPITNAEDEYAELDVFVQGWQQLQRITTWPAAAIRITEARFVWPGNWLKVPDLALAIGDLAQLYLAVSKMLCDRGLQHDWPYKGFPDPAKAPILVN